MDKKSLLGLGIISILMVVYFVYFVPKPEPQTDLPPVQDSIAANVELPPADTVVMAEITGDSLEFSGNDSLQTLKTRQMFGVFHQHAYGEEKLYYIENEYVILGFSNLGGKLVSAELKEFLTYDAKYHGAEAGPLQLMIPDSSVFSLEFFHESRLIQTGNLYFDVEQPSAQSLRFLLKSADNPNQYIAFNYHLPQEGYMADMQIQLEQMNQVVDPGTGYLDLYWHITSPKQELDLKNERSRSTVYYRELAGDVERVTRGGAGSETVQTNVDWVSFKQQFFSATLIVPSGMQKPAIQIMEPASENMNLSFSLQSALAFENKPSQVVDMKLYTGPNHYQSLKKLGYDLEEQIDLGYIGIFKWVNTLLIIPVFNFFESLGLGYGLIIFLLTVIIKILLSPLNFKTFVSSAKMRVLKPEIDALGEKFKKPEDALKKQQAMMQLYRQAGVNPLAGCLPAILQMPILLAMFSFFPSAIELRQESFLWAKDLSSYDSILDLSFSIPFYGDHVSLFTLLMTITTVVYTWMSSGQMQSGPQAQQMKIMMFIMPIIFLGVLNNYSAALSYYYFLSNLLSITIMIVIRRFFIDEKKLRAKIESYMANPSKAPKSKWMKRLEDAQRARQEQLKNQGSPKNRSGRRNQ